MTDIFTKNNFQKLMKNRVIWFLGDSNIRALYKDCVWLWQQGTLIPQKWLRSKLENSYMNDELTAGGKLSRGRDYVEERCYEDMKNGFAAEFMFLTRCFSPRLQAKINNIKSDRDSPDVVVINSLLWDICRWGPTGVTTYRENLFALFKLMKQRFAPSTLVLWLTTAPVSCRIRGAFLIEQLQFMENSCRFDIMEGNVFARDAAIAHGFDVLDVHFYLLQEIKRRSQDGVHWEPPVVRFVTNLILTHISLAWNQPLPGNFTGPVIDRMIANTKQPSVNQQALINVLESCLAPTKLPTPPKKRRNRKRNRSNEQNLEPEKHSYNRRPEHYAPY